MAAKYLHSLADENPDLQKQIGCVTGIFQIFNRHHIGSRRRVFSLGSKRGDHGSLRLNNGTPQRDSSVMGQRHLAMDKHRVSTESSKDSSGSRPMKSQNLDLRDVVKDSMYREARGLSNDWYQDQPRELARSKSCQFRDRVPPSVCKDYPRFSYDGRETDSKQTNPKQLKELPRLSLDSRPVNPYNSKSNLSRNPNINGGIDADKDTNHTRPPGVVAKLMGLETFPFFRSVMKPISRVPIEPAPWKQRDGARAMTSSMTRRPVSNAYSEVDTRLKNLDLKNRPCVRGHESHIVIMKPTKLVKKGFINTKTGQDRITECTRVERLSRPSMSLTDSSKPRKQSNKQRSESRSQSRSRKPSNFKKDDQNREAQMFQKLNTYEKPTLPVKVDEPLTSEYPSPVSVLDDSVYVENSPSPVKRTPITEKADATVETVKDRYAAPDDVQPNTISRVSFQTNREKLKKVENLVQKLKNLNSTHDDSHTDYIASLCDNTNPNDRYISEIFLASGLLLRDLASFNIHPSGHPINPELFLVLEHTKFSNLQKDKFNRKVIFDVVNEILMGKLSSGSMQDPRKLLRELCLEVEHLQARKKIDACGVGNEGDVLKKSEIWSGFYGESVVIAMEVERLILIDLVNEVVMS